MSCTYIQRQTINNKKIEFLIIILEVMTLIEKPFSIRVNRICKTFQSVVCNKFGQELYQDFSDKGTKGAKYLFCIKCRSQFLFSIQFPSRTYEFRSNSIAFPKAR